MISFEKVSKRFKSTEVLKSISFSIDQGDLVAFIGESGCGKTTLLKMVNRLLKPSSGNIFFKGKNIAELDEVSLRRQIGYVIQQTGLFPHMTVQENIELIPSLQKINPDTILQNTNRLLNMVGLEPDTFMNRYPTELSGGQQQRVGVARAFATDPDLILMDEPFSALDPMTRSDLQDELIYLQAKLKKTIMFVTHDMDEAVKIADKICIMRNGKILQYDTPENILKNPVDDYVSDFVGKNRIWASPEYIKVSDIMLDRPITVSPDITLLRCLDKMRQKKVDSLLVIDHDDRRLLGILKARRIRDVESKSALADAYMNKEVITLSPDENILDALKLITEKNCSLVPVTDHRDRLVGLITRSSLVTALSQQYFECDEEVAQ